MSHDAYARAQKQSANPRDSEYRAFAKVTKALIDVSESESQNLKSMIEAIHMNRTLWGALANDCANPHNQLPEDLRARIIGLSRWVAAYSSDVMRKRESLEPLIDINRIMMDGLSHKTSAQAG